MELLGGIGFLEEFPLAKLHRDALVTSIWEGTSNIQSLDMAEAFFKKDAGRAYMEEVSTEISKIGDQEARQKLSAALAQARDEVANALNDGVEFHSKRLLSTLGTLYAAALFQRWAEGLGEEWAQAMSKIYIQTELLKKDVDHATARKAAEGLSWMSL